MPNGGTLTLETRDVVLTEQYITMRPGIAIVPGPYTSLVVSDTGVGMDEETIRHLFEPFFTTKPVGQGSGLGLAMVYGIVKQSGGYIWAYSEPGRGSTLKLYFPAVPAAPLPAAPAPESRAVAPGGATILVVEDDPVVRAMARRALSEAGYTVLEAGNGREALDVAAVESSLDVVLTDLAMPGIGGRELARRLREQRPDLPIVYMSGYTDDEVIRRGLLDSGVPFLEKPMSPETLLGKIRQVLDEQRGAPGGVLV
jgi:two-component system, cell cycle sensor histidine kinase and response regulator CckA